MAERFIKDDPTTRYNRVLTRAATMPRGPASILPSGAGVMENYTPPAAPQQRWGMGLGDTEPSPTGGTTRSPLARRIDISPEGIRRRAATAIPGVRFGTNQPAPTAVQASQSPLPGDMAPDMQAETLSPFQQRFGRDTQGAYSEDTGRFAAPDDRRGQRTRDFAARRGIPQMSETSPEGRVLAQQESATSRFRRGENLPGEMIGADGITYMRGSRMDGGTGIVGGGSSGGPYGNAAAEVIGTAQRIGQRRGLRRDQAIAREQEQQMFEREISEGNLRANLGNARAQLLNAQPTPKPGTFKVNPPKINEFGLKDEYGTIEANGREYAVTMDQILEIQDNTAYLLSLDPSLTEDQAQDQALMRFIRGLTNTQE